MNTSEISKSFDHYNCLLCGEHNRWGLGIKFKLLDDGRVYTKFKPLKVLQGYKEILHGGVICALMDCAMVHCFFHHSIKAVTADINIRFLKSVPCSIDLDLFGELVSSRKKLYYMKSELTYNGKIMAFANGKFIRTDR